MSTSKFLRSLAWGYGAVFTVAAVLFLCLEPQRWNNPAITTQTEHGTFKSLSAEFKYVLSCTCPKIAVVGRSATLEFNLELTRLSTQPAFYTPAEIRADAAADSVKVTSNGFPDLSGLELGKPVSIPFRVALQGVQTSLTQINLRLLQHPIPLKGQPAPTELTTLENWSYPIEARQPFSTMIVPYVYALVVLSALGGLAFWLNRRLRLLREKSEKNISDASSLVEANPAAARFAWDLARIKLESYFDRNLLQVNLVFWVACGVMAVGFGFVLAGVWYSYTRPQDIRPSLVAAISGIITQFIGATFMVIYRSTMAQANEFMTVLERINTVGMAVQILDALKEGTELKDKTRAELATGLLAAKSGLQRTPASIGRKSVRAK